MAELVDVVEIGTVEIPRGEEPLGVPGAPTLPAAPSRRAKVTRSAFYTAHAKVKKEIDKAGKGGLCLTPEEIATKTNIDIEDVKEHIEIIKLDEAGAEVHEKSGVVCSTDGMSKLVETLRRLRT